MNVFQNPEHKARIGYNGFDMSQLRKFTATTGQLLPVYHAVLSPGDKVSIQSELKTRTKPLASPAMASIQERVEWFFVPMEQIFDAFSAFYYGVQDLGSSFYVNESGDVPSSINIGKFPNLPLSRVLLASRSFNNLLGKFTSSDTFADTLRLLDSLGFPVLQFMDNLHNYDLDRDENWLTDIVYFNRSVSLLLPAAYQKIYYDYYRLSDRESNRPDAYNLDQLTKKSSTDLPNASIARLFQLHYRPFSRDYFTSTQVSPLFTRDNQSSFGVGSGFDYGKVDQWLTGTNRVAVTDTLGLEGPEATQVSLVNSQTVPDQYNSIARVSPSNIRALFAVDKLLEITRRAGKHYDMQTLAHFGVEVPSGLTGEVLFLGGSDSRIDIGDVISTAGTESVDLGQLAGKGYSFSRSGNIQFEAKSHGVLMAIYSAVPELDYFQTGVDPETILLDRTDFVIPEYDELGMQPLFNYSVKVDAPDQELNSILGWTPRYLPFKAKSNVVNSGFAGGLQYWTTAVTPLQGSNALTSFLCPPNMLDSIMLAAYNSRLNVDEHTSSVDDIFGTDPLISQIYFDVKKSSKMSTFGLPNL